MYPKYVHVVSWGLGVYSAASEIGRKFVTKFTPGNPNSGVNPVEKRALASYACEQFLPDFTSHGIHP